MPDLKLALRESPQSFNLFQAINLLERSEPTCRPVGRGLGLDEAVRLAAEVEFGFAPSDIASVAASGRPGPALTLRTAALTLAGAQGPLAAPFTELMLVRRVPRERAGLDFLDIFNQRLLGLWYRARAKHHLSLQAIRLGAEPRLAPLERSIDALSGLGRAEGAHAPDGQIAWLRHAALQGAAPRSMTSLLALLRHRLGIAFSGQQFIGCWEPLADSDRARLQGPGRRSGFGLVLGLGRGATLGARAWDQSAGVALTSPPLPAHQFAALLPGGSQYQLLAWLVARHLQRDITVTVELELARLPISRLAALVGPAPQHNAPPRLGRNAWLCAAPGSRHAGDHGIPRPAGIPVTPGIPAMPVTPGASVSAAEAVRSYRHARFVLALPITRLPDRS